MTCCLPSQTSTAPTTLQVPESTPNDVTQEPPVSLPHDLDAIKEFIQHGSEHDFIQLISAITPTKKRRMFFLPLEFNKVNIEALVDSGAYVNAISKRDAKKYDMKQISPSSTKSHLHLSKPNLTTLNSINPL